MSISILMSLIVPLAMIGFVLFWLSIVWMIGRLSAWHQLAQRYATNREPSGDQFGWKSVRFGLFTNYSNSVNIAVSFEGIYLRPVVFFRAGHKPLMLPWEAISKMEHSGGGFLASTHLTVQPLDGGKPQTMTLYGQNVADSLRRNAPFKLNHGDEFA